MMRAFAFLAALLLTSAAQARHNDLVDLSLRDLDTGQVLPVYWSGDQTFVPGTPGHRYAVVLHNRSAERVLAVLSVDGVNAVTGQTANPAQSGYVLGPYQSTEVRGWRKDLSSIAEFVFTDLGDSYAARTYRPDNVGVIGIAVFRERPIVRPYEPPYYSQEGEQPAPSPRGALGRSADSAAPPATASKSAPQARQELGTGHGTRRYDPVSRTECVRASTRPEQVVSMYYDDTRALIARGIIPRHERTPQGRQDPFPMGFVADPPRRRW
jgi:hypothetical protein